MPLVFDDAFARLPGGGGLWLRRSLEGGLVLLISAELALLAPGVLKRPEPETATGPATLVDTSILSRFDAFARNGGGGGPTASAPDSLRLFGVRSGGAAIIAGPDGVQQSYRVGEAVQPGLVLARVAPDHVVLSRGGAETRLEFLAAAPGAAPASVSPPPVAMAPPAPPPPSAPAAKPSIVDLARLGMQAGIKPVDGGFALVPRGGGDILSQAGLRAGDVITAVDGQPLAPDTIGDLAATFAGRSSAQVTVLRDGRPTTLTLQAPR